MSHPASPSAASDLDALPHQQPRQAEDAEERSIPSQELLAGRTSVTIDHQGMQYVLRATRAGKLILTK